jgi:hypothetical protein
MLLRLVGQPVSVWRSEELAHSAIGVERDQDARLVEFWAKHGLVVCSAAMAVTAASSWRLRRVYFVGSSRELGAELDQLVARWDLCRAARNGGPDRKPSERLAVRPAFPRESVAQLMEHRLKGSSEIFP